jgi:hypothetical protein
MPTQHKKLRFVIPALLALVVLLVTGCENPTGSDDTPPVVDATDPTDAPAQSDPPDPRTLILPAEVVQDWDPEGWNGFDWALSFWGIGGFDAPFLGILTLDDENYPGQTFLIGDFEDHLAASTSRGDDGIFNATGTTVTITPDVQMMRALGLFEGGGEIVRKSASGELRIEWWYVSEDAVADGNYTSWEIIPAEPALAYINEIQLSTGWNTMIFTKRGDNSGWDVTTGVEPVGVNWHLEAW